jgi:hypothetical protein
MFVKTTGLGRVKRQELIGCTQGLPYFIGHEYLQAPTISTRYQLMHTDFAGPAELPAHTNQLYLLLLSAIKL